MTDEVAVDNLKRGVEVDASFAAIQTRHYLGVYRTVRSHVRNRHEAEDITQSAFEVAFHRINRYDKSRATLESWVGGIAWNLLRMSWRRTKPDRRRLCSLDDSMAACGCAPDEVWARKCSHAVLSAILAGAAREDREWFEAHFGDRESYEELARRSGRSVRHIRYRCGLLMRAARRAYGLRRGPAAA